MTILHSDCPPGQAMVRGVPCSRIVGARCGTLAGAASAVARDTQAARQPAANTSGNPRECWQPDCRGMANGGGMTQSSRLITTQLHLRGGHAPV